MVWGVGGFCDVERAIVRVLRVFLVMMSLSKKYLFLATLKGHSDPPPSPITVKPIFFCDSRPKNRGGGADPNQSPAGGSLGGGGPIVPYIYIL